MIGNGPGPIYIIIFFRGFEMDNGNFRELKGDN